MPLLSQRLDHHLRDRLATTGALAAEAATMTADAPGKAVLLDKRRGFIERIAALGAEEMADVPLAATGQNDLAFNRGLARATARAEFLMEVQVAVEAHAVVAVGLFRMLGFRGREREAVDTGVDACEAGVAEGAGFGVEGDAFEEFAAFETAEAGGVEALRGGAYNASGDREGAGGALGGGAVGGERPVWLTQCGGCGCRVLGVRALSVGHLGAADWIWKSTRA